MPNKLFKTEKVCRQRTLKQGYYFLPYVSNTVISSTIQNSLHTVNVFHLYNLSDHEIIMFIGHDLLSLCHYFCCITITRKCVHNVNFDLHPSRRTQGMGSKDLGLLVVELSGDTQSPANRDQLLS